MADRPLDRFERIEVTSRAQWRDWLTAHHPQTDSVWVVTYKKGAAQPRVPYDDLVEEALAFGWVDSLIKRIDADRHLLKFTPRKPTSKWSDSNRKRWAELAAAGLLTPAGKAAAPTANRYAPKPRIPELPAYIAKALRANRRAWAFFQELSPTNRRQYVVWIHIAKREETRARRLAESIELLAAGKQLGLR